MGLERTPGNPRPKEGVLYCMDTDLTVTEKFAPVDISNGLSWSADKQTMFYCDSLKVNRVSQNNCYLTTTFIVVCSVNNRRL